MLFTELITAEELKKHGTDTDLWILLDGKAETILPSLIMFIPNLTRFAAQVYDVTKYKDEHPGKPPSLALGS